jgi:hypothetical protein
MQWYSDFGHLTRDVVIISDQLGEPMKKLTRRSFSPEFRLEVSLLVVDQNYTVLQRPRP